MGRGDPNDGANQIVSGGANGVPGGGDDIVTRAGLAAPEGWLVTPHDGDGITADEVTAIINNAIAQADRTRAAIRLPLGTRAKFVFAVADRQGNIVGLFRQPDATIFSIDVAVAKARNVAYYAEPGAAPGDRPDRGRAAGDGVHQPHVPVRWASRGSRRASTSPRRGRSRSSTTTRSARTGSPGVQVGPPLPASAYQSVVGFDSFNPGTNFHDPFNILNQNGIVFFPGSSALYERGALIGGFGVSGDGVDQDDVTTVAGQTGFDAPLELRADQFIVRGVRLPYQKFNRNPEG